jgi:hypothetical protein
VSPGEWQRRGWTPQVFVLLSLLPGSPRADSSLLSLL